jgi:apolipoprotein N-acyltransferase
MKQYRKDFLLFSISLIIISFAQPAWVNFFCYFAAIFGYCLFWISIKNINSKKRRFWISTLFFAIANCVHLSWMSSTKYQTPFILIVYAFFVFCIGIEFAIVSVLVPRKKSDFKIIHIFALPAIYTLFEWSRIFFLSGFTWNPIGLALTNNHLSIQLASIVGIYGLSYIVLMINVLFYFAIEFIKEKREYLHIGILIVFGIYIFGYINIHIQKKSFFESKKIKVALVQTSLYPEQRGSFSSYEKGVYSPLEQWDRIFSFFKDIKEEKIDMIVFPEIAVPFDAFGHIYPLHIIEWMWKNYFPQKSNFTFPKLQYPHSFLKGNINYVSNSYLAKMISNYFESDVLIGLENISPSTNLAYSCCFCFHPNNDLFERYKKQKLVPIGEYFPFAWSKEIAKKFGIIDCFTPGKKNKIFKTKDDVKIASSICYEETYSSLILKKRKKGANLFVNITNDGWFPKSKLPKQHFDHGKIRAVENGVGVIRSCNTGITAGIDCFGRVIKKLTKKNVSHENIAGVLILDVPLYNYHTIYSMWGDVFIVCLSIFFACFFLCSFRNKPCLK